MKKYIDRIERFEGFCDSEVVKELMKEYAEFYAKKCLEVASQNATVQVYWEEGFSCINSESILNIKLPDHE